MSSSMESFLAFLFQFIWPGAILAAITAAVAIWRRHFIWLLISTLCLTPFLFYLGMTPRFTYAPYFLILHAFAILNMRRGHVKVASVALIPTLVLALYVAYLVLAQ
ncbi:hypothetical protein JJB07_22380 [Tumebacillus sp. ITR2]|uniref:Uncharacterized protein n=1 Tax=Tumebacillus amylolyticus TaxID=2801339 RepID=A0ABS1JGF6_9BACL|nr:hypothetical protein [Tumebacillus amylolyticus]MBL0389343.1 hypothetical protein [Tumebacillus amylolyticus]